MPRAAARPAWGCPRISQAMAAAAGSRISAASQIARFPPASARAGSQAVATAAISHAGVSTNSATGRQRRRRHSIRSSILPSSAAAARDRGRVMFTSSQGIFSAAMV